MDTEKHVVKEESHFKLRVDKPLDSSDLPRLYKCMERLVTWVISLLISSNL